MIWWTVAIRFVYAMVIILHVQCLHKMQLKSRKIIWKPRKIPVDKRKTAFYTGLIGENFPPQTTTIPIPALTRIFVLSCVTSPSELRNLPHPSKSVPPQKAWSLDKMIKNRNDPKVGILLILRRTFNQKQNSMELINICKTESDVGRQSRLETRLIWLTLEQNRFFKRD